MERQRAARQRKRTTRNDPAMSGSVMEAEMSAITGESIKRQVLRFLVCEHARMCMSEEQQLLETHDAVRPHSAFLPGKVGEGWLWP